MATAILPPGLTDSDILIDGARNLPEGVAFLGQQLATGALQVSIVSAMELVAGCRDKKELALVRQFLAPVRVLPISEEVSDLSYQLMESYHLSHGLLVPDALIAATALKTGLPLYTKNTRHFQMIPDLVTRRPY
jgi:predicted nucleic acid-binding protein